VHKQKNILIVEDNKDMQIIYKNILGGKYHLLIAGNTKEAMFKLQRTKIDLMMLDIILPKETGDTFLVHIRQKPKFNYLKVLVVTVLGNITEQLRKIDPNVVCIAKPFDESNLLSVTNNIIGKNNQLCNGM